MTRQEVIDALGDEHVLGLNPRREWLVQQIMLLVDAYTTTQLQEAAVGRYLQLPRLRRGPDR